MHTPAHKNLFPGSLAHIAEWEGERLEARSKAIYSSQALCISVFGTIATSDRRAMIVDDILATAGIDLKTKGDTELKCEMRDRRDVLNEYGGSNPTCPDVVIDWSDAVMTVESKFTEHLGTCGQIKAQKIKRPDGRKVTRPPACSGNHEIGSDLRTRTAAACRLTIQERTRLPRLYWDVGRRLFRPDVLTPPRQPCPFRDRQYQLMRNICFAARLSELQRRPTFGFLLVYVAAAPVAHDSEHDFAEFKAMLLPEVARLAGAISYEQIEEIVRRHEQTALADWLGLRIRQGIAARANSTDAAT
jgi:hypothetical protein